MVDRAKKISELPSVAAITNNDLFIVVTNTAGTAVTKQITINNFRAGLPPIVVGIANTSCTGVVAVGNNLTANATGWLTLSSNVVVTNVNTQTLRADSTAEFTANVYLGLLTGDPADQLIHVHGVMHTNVVPYDGGVCQLGNTTNTWQHVYANDVIVSNVISTDINTQTLIANGTVELTANVYLGVIDGDDASQLIHVHGTLHSNLVPHTPDNYQLGNTTNYFQSVNIRTVNFADNTSMNTAFKWVSAPASASATGTAGSIAYDSGYIYVCVANNTWVRAALNSW